jgi:hypothetical protein
MTATVTLPGVYVDYLRGTEVWEGDDGPASRELGDALRAAPRRKVGKGWNVRVALSRPALRMARDYALDMIETAGYDYDPSWPRAGRTVLARIDAALTATN